ncbi:LacI family DNA-binding transcriptional regulator [Alicyclobacillus dauci]|uniref:LacI family transcriptional regulator n=1 Tax=Alicyclobacillus dauci TaxID=1475485 RepID=A0ABY6Z3F2_9BACL|nr:LacI family DNA-binding transcriptional regulator [Alicyclobacillus dauci]WAH37053.1 LacI family transcriptional regulator [Alicyclobacillus dauci]
MDVRRGVIIVSVTIKDVAKAAGVSIATVSRVLGKTKPVSSELEMKVRQVIKELGYVPNEVARSLITNSSSSIGVIVPKLEYSVSGSWLRGVERFARLQGYSVILTVSDGQTDKEIESFNVMQQKRVDGVIWSAVDFSEDHGTFLADYPIPVVAVGQDFEPYGIPSVVFQNGKIGYDATRYLLKLGHKRIAMIAGNMRDSSSGKDRLEGYRKALREAGITEEETLVAVGDFTMDSGYECMKKLLPYGPTAVFAASDTMAIGAMHYASQAGIRIPDELSVMGVDNLEICQHLNPTLSTVDYDAGELGTTAARLVLKMDQEDSKAQCLSVPHKLVIRDSVREIGGCY